MESYSDTMAILLVFLVLAWYVFLGAHGVYTIMVKNGNACTDWHIWALVISTVLICGSIFIFA